MADVRLEDLRVVIFGAGSAGTGVADQISDAIATETGKNKAEASKQIWCVLTAPYLNETNQADGVSRAGASTSPASS